MSIETRFWRCSHSVKTGVVDPFLYIFMVNNVFSYKNHQKHSRDPNRWFYYVIWAPELRNSPKNGSLNHDLLNLLNLYGIYWMISGWYQVNPHVHMYTVYSLGKYSPKNMVIFNGIKCRTPPPLNATSWGGRLSSRFVDLLNSMTYGLKRSVDQKWLFGPLLHSSLGNFPKKSGNFYVFCH